MQQQQQQERYTFRYTAKTCVVKENREIGLTSSQIKRSLHYLQLDAKCEHVNKMRHKLKDGVMRGILWHIHR